MGFREEERSSASAPPTRKERSAGPEALAGSDTWKEERSQRRGRSSLAPLLDDLIPAHREHLHLSLEYASSTHLNNHHDELRRYFLEQSEQLKA